MHRKEGLMFKTLGQPDSVMNTLAGYTKEQHEEAAGMGLDDRFFNQFQKLQPAKNLTDNLEPEEGYYGHEAGCDCAVCDDIAMQMERSVKWFADFVERFADDYKSMQARYKDCERHLKIRNTKIAELNEEIEQVTQTANNFHDAWGKYRDALEQIADYHGTTDEVWSNSMKAIAREALADRP